MYYTDFYPNRNFLTLTLKPIPTPTLKLSINPETGL